MCHHHVPLDPTTMPLLSYTFERGRAVACKMIVLPKMHTSTPTTIFRGRVRSLLANKSRVPSWAYTHTCTLCPWGLLAKILEWQKGRVLGRRNPLGSGLGIVPSPPPCLAGL